MKWLLLMACLPVPLRAELTREAFPVPPAVAAAFTSGGLAAFDPFDTWDGDQLRPASMLPTASTGEHGARLPFGECYDVLPAWTARGFKPHDGTRVFYQPRTQMLFAVTAPEDEAQVRAFCEWPPAVWMNTASWGGGSGVKQVLYRITAYEIPATGPGGWDFQPATAEELLALPASARRILSRQSMILRGGQRAKVEGVSQAQRSRGTTLSGMVAEAECTVGEDGWTVDLNNAPELKVTDGDGSHALLRCQFQQLIRWGDSWLLEAGTLPGQPPRRIFHVYECLHLNGDDNPARSHQRWAGRTAKPNAGGRAIYLPYFPPAEPPLLPPPVGVQTDPFAAGDEPPSPPAVRMPELFGDVPVQEYSSALIKATGAPAGGLQAWCREGSSYLYYIRGKPEGMAALDHWLAEQKVSSYLSQVLVESTVSLQPPGGERRIIWRNTITVRAGQRSGVWLSAGSLDPEEEDAPFGCFLMVEATREPPPQDDPHSVEDDLWKLTVGGSLAAPLVDRAVVVAAATETGTRDAASLRRFLGYTKSGEEIVLTSRLRQCPVTSPNWRAAPRDDWWWWQQLTKTAK
jgi:hypothetical protein